MAAVPQRAPHREPQSSDPPPTLPPRPGPGGRVPFRPPPVVPPADSDDDSNADDYVEPGSDTDGPDILYDDFNEGDDQDHANWNAKDEPAPPPLPPHPELEEITYDDCEEPALPPQPPLPKRPPARLPPIPPVPPIPETYDDVENVGPVVVKPPKTQVRQLPPPPVQPTKVEDVGDVYEDPDASKDLPTTDKNPESVYEVGDPEEEEPHQLPPSIDRPEHPPPLLPGKPSAAKTAGGAGAPGFAMNIGQLQNVKQGLRKVSLEENTIKTKNNDPKVYGDYPQSVADVKKKFQEKQGKDLKPGVLQTVRSVRKPVSPLPSIPVPHPNSKPSVPVLPPNSKPVTKFEPLPPKPDDFEDQEIYDDACSESELTRYDWYHGSIDRMKGEQRVKSVGKDGTYLVRVSEKDPHFPYTLVVLHKGHVNNLRIRLRHDKKFALGDEKTDELAFADVIAMINHHKNHHVVLLGSNQSQVKLQFTPAKK